jgi:hypothetical protein
VIISLNIVTQLIFVMVKCGVLSEVRTEFLSIIYTSFDFKGLSRIYTMPVGSYESSAGGSERANWHGVNAALRMTMWTGGVTENVR